MKNITAKLSLSCAATIASWCVFSAFIPQANQAWVTNKIDEVVGTNTAARIAAVAQAATNYTDAAIAAAGVVTPQVVTNISGAVISNHVQSGYIVPYVVDDDGNRTAVTIGSRLSTVGKTSLSVGKNCVASGTATLAQGTGTKASGSNSAAFGSRTTASGSAAVTFGEMSQALGFGSSAFGSYAKASHNHSFVWNGIAGEWYESRALGSYNLNPIGGLSGFWVGETNMATYISTASASTLATAKEYTDCATNAVARIVMDDCAIDANLNVYGEDFVYTNQFDVYINQYPSYSIRLYQDYDAAAGSVSFTNNYYGSLVRLHNDDLYLDVWRFADFYGHDHICTPETREYDANTPNTLMVESCTDTFTIKRVKVPKETMTIVSRLATTNDIMTASTVTNIVREANGGVWDAALQVWWTPVMSNGKLTYQATTNVNLNAGN